MHSALKPLSFVSLLGLLVVACESKTDAVPDAGVTVVAVPASTETPTVASAAPSTVTPAAGGGGAVRPSGVSLDAGSAAVVEAVDAGAGQQCCCEAPSFPLQSVAMTDCSKVRKGACVAKTRCTADAGAPATPAAAKPDAGSEQTCCCATGDAKAVTGMSACTKGGKGKCVKATECK